MLQLNIEAKQSAYLNNVLILKPCLAFSKSNEAIEMIKQAKLFDDLDSIDYLLIKPKVIFHLITITEEFRKALFHFIMINLETSDSILQKLTLVDKFIHQMFFLINEAKGELKDSLKSEFEHYKQIVTNRLLEIQSNYNSNFYLELIINVLMPDSVRIDFTKIYTASFLNEDASIPLTQQIKLRRLNENNLNYTVSFNHLLNEFQNLFELVYFEAKQKTSKDITGKMSEEKYGTRQIKFVTDFFDRRNQNSISHTNLNEIGLWGVGYIEYLDYKQKLAPLLDKLFKKYIALRAVASEPLPEIKQG